MTNNVLHLESNISWTPPMSKVFSIWETQNAELLQCQKRIHAASEEVSWKSRGNRVYIIFTSLE